MLSGWGRTSPTAARVVPVDTVDAARDAIASAGPRGTLARGLGRSYGDSAQSAGGTVLDMTRLDRILGFDAGTGLVDVEAGVSLDELMRRFVPRGWFVPVTPGTRFVTVGGAIAADIHGKNHHVAGSFGQYVRSMRLLTADGNMSTLQPDSDPERFWATVGGMGLTGVVVSATVQLIPIGSAYVAVDTVRAPDLDSLMSSLVELEERHPYTVAWVDGVARSEGFGRGVVTAGRFASGDDLTATVARDPFEPPRPPALAAPPVVPSGLLNRWSIAAFNALWYRKAPRERRDELQHLSTFFHPLDGIEGWNRIYGAGGFVQYQFVVPEDASRVVAQALEGLAAIGAASFLAVLKRLGPASPGPLSFPSPGWTLALDIPVAVDGLQRTLDQLDEAVVSAGGRVYLAKDSRMRADLVPAMYPRLQEWRDVRQAMDPDNVFASDQSRRLHL